MPPAVIINGIQDTVPAKLNEFFLSDDEREDFGGIEKEWVFEDEIKAPVNEGISSAIVYRLNGQEIGRVEIVAAESIRKANFLDYLKRAASSLCVMQY